MVTITSSKMNTDDELKCLLITLPSLWDTICTVVSNSVSNGKLVYTDICGALFGEEICRKSMIASHNGDAYNIYDVGFLQEPTLL